MKKTEYRFEKLFDSIENNRIIFYLINILAAVAFMLINHYTPFYADDLHHFKMFGTDEPIKGVWDAAESSYLFYLGWSGRVIPGFFIRALQLFPKTIYNILNTMAFCTLTVLVHKHAFGAKTSNTFLLTVYLGFWFCLQSFGGTVVWMSASIEYMWGIMLSLLFLLPYNRLAFSFDGAESVPGARNSILFPLGMLLFGIIASSFSEIMGVCACAFILIILIMKATKRHSTHGISAKKFCLWEITGFRKCQTIT